MPVDRNELREYDNNDDFSEFPLESVCWDGWRMIVQVDGTFDKGLSWVRKMIVVVDLFFILWNEDYLFFLHSFIDRRYIRSFEEAVTSYRMRNGGNLFFLCFL